MFNSLQERFKTLSAAFLVLLLGVSGLSIFLWMAGTGWQDVHGIAMGVLFILLSVAQSVYGVIWYRASTKWGADQQLDQEASGKEMVAMSNSSTKEAEYVKGMRESGAPLLANRESANVVDVSEVQIQNKMATNVESQA